MRVIRYPQTLALSFSSRHHIDYESWVSDTMQNLHRHYRRFGPAITILALLSGCATTQPQVVKVPVPQPCLTAEQLPTPPDAKNDAELTKLDDFDLVLELASQRLEYRRYSNEAQAVLKACVK